MISKWIEISQDVSLQEQVSSIEKEKSRAENYDQTVKAAIAKHGNFYDAVAALHKEITGSLASNKSTDAQIKGINEINQRLATAIYKFAHNMGLTLNNTKLSPTP